MNAVLQEEHGSKDFILALDAGGTMTDTILVLPDGTFKVGKSLTNREHEPTSYLESVEDAARSIDLTSAEIHRRAAVSIYAGTGMLNTLLTGTGRRPGLLVTRGFEDISVIEGGLTYLGQAQHEMLHNQLHEHTRPMINPRDICGISERTCVGSYFMDKHLPPGEILIPVHEAQVRAAVTTLLDRGVEIIGILFTGSFINPANEMRAQAIARAVVEERGLDVPVVCSHEVAPVMKENNRLKSLLLQLTAAEHTRGALKQVERAARDDGYGGQLLTLLSYGGAVNISYSRLYETVISGPIGGLMGAQVLSRKLGLRNLLCCDMGGTSFDVGLVVNHQIPIRKDPDFAGHRLALPMVALDSVGAGAGSAVWLDQYKRLHVGPESAGSRVGMCFRYDKLTVTDVNLVLGYVDPDYFLGGKVRLDRERAMKALEEQIARPLGLDIYTAAQGILEVINTNMREAALTMMLAKGYDPNEFTVLCYGGAGPVHMWGFTEGLKVADVVTVPYAAAFSAFGAACAEYMHRYHRGHITALPNDASDEYKCRVGAEIDAVFRSLEDAARREMEAEGADVAGITFSHGVYARYIGQLESFDTPLDFGHLHEARDIDRMVAAFEEMYTKIYPAGARFPEVGYAISELYVKAKVPKAMPVMLRHRPGEAQPAVAAFVGKRTVCHKGVFTEFDVWQMGELAAGNVVQGPAIIRDPMTTVVVPPGRRIEFDEYLVLHYR